MITKLVIYLMVPMLLAGCIPSLRRDRAGQQSGSSQFLKGTISGQFPNLPRYPQSQVIESYNVGDLFGVFFISEEGLGKVVNFYIDALADLQWESELKKQSETHYVFEFKNERHKGSIIINRAAGGRKTAITVYGEPR